MTDIIYLTLYWYALPLLLSLIGSNIGIVDKDASKEMFKFCFVPLVNISLVMCLGLFAFTIFLVWLTND